MDMRPEARVMKETLRFLRGVLPDGGARVLEVGCGRGALAARLLAEGRRVTAIDISAEAVQAAQALGVPAIRIDLASFDGGPFDAVLFTRSLHHIHPLAAAVERAHDLLAPAGALVADEFAWDAVDRAAAAWFYDVTALLQAAEVLAPGGHHAGVEGDPLERWRADHSHHEPLHGGEAMLEAIGARFEIERVERVPYFYRHIADRLEQTPRGGAVCARMQELEALRIAQGLLRPVGLRAVARRRPTPD
jgi:SAM-dependent methyltransferase